MLSGVAAAALAGQGPINLDLDRTGRALHPAVSVKAGRAVTIRVTDHGSAFNCSDPATASRFTVSYAWLRDIQLSGVIPADRIAGEDTRGLIRLERPPDGREFLAYAFVEEPWGVLATDVLPLIGCGQALAAAAATHAVPLKAVRDAKDLVAQASTALDSAKTRVKNLQNRVAVLKTAGGDAGGSALVKAQDDLDVANADVVTRTANETAARAGLAAARAGLAAARDDVPAELGGAVLLAWEDAAPALAASGASVPPDPLATVTKIMSGFACAVVPQSTPQRCVPKGLRLRRSSGLFVTGSNKTVSYDFYGRTLTSTIPMPMVGEAPVIYQGDRVYAVVLNVMPSRHSYAFTASTSTQPAAPINVTPVRPVMTSPSITFSAPPTIQLGINLSEGYTDMFLPIDAPVIGNTAFTVSIKTERPDPTDPSKFVSVPLVEAARWPAVRYLYRFNINTGVVTTVRPSDRDQAFSKLKTQSAGQTTVTTTTTIASADQTTKTVTETKLLPSPATYTSATNPVDPAINPILAFGVNVVAVDTQAPFSRRRLIPVPTIGFSMKNPTGTLMLGATIEFAPNVQLTIGEQWTPYTALVTRNLIDEPSDGSAFPTRVVHRWVPVVGLTFNLDLITKVFK